eukprot:scaffold58486_cov27-Phaeocystis_antarctica.AAC.1
MALLTMAILTMAAVHQLLQREVTAALQRDDVQAGGASLPGGGRAVRSRAFHRQPARAHTHRDETEWHLRAARRRGRHTPTPYP